jgi:tetratricopeptide (TPR) repeat protein
MALDYDVYALPAYHILAVSARAEGDSLRASNALERIEEIDPMSHIPFAEHWLAEDGNEARAELRARFRGEFPGQEIIELGLAYAAVGRMGEARAVMSLADGTSVEPLTRAWIAHSSGNVGDLGAPASVDFVFPFRREMLPVLTWAADNTDHWGWRYLLALVLAARDRPLEAANELRAIGLKPDYAPVYTTRALLVNDDEADRERDLRYAVELNPDERLLRIPLIQHLQAARNWDEAVRASGSALEIFPKDFDLALLHVRSLNELERYEESIRIMHDIQVLPSEHSLGAHQLFADAEVMAGLIALERGELEVANDHFFMAMTWPERLGQGRPYSPEERLPRFLLALSRWLSDDSEGASRAWTAVVDATPDSVFWGESATRLDLLGALSLEALGRQEELKSFGDVGVGALAPVANQVRAASRAGESVALAVAAITVEIDEIFDDVQGRLIQKVLGFASQVIH